MAATPPGSSRRSSMSPGGQDGTMLGFMARQDEVHREVLGLKRIGARRPSEGCESGTDDSAAGDDHDHDHDHDHGAQAAGCVPESAAVAERESMLSRVVERLVGILTLGRERTALDYEGHFRATWLLLVTALVCYQVFFLPARLCFPILAAFEDNFRPLDLFCDVVFLVDMYLNTKFAVMEDGIVITDPKQILVSYCARWDRLPRDLVACLSILRHCTAWGQPVRWLPLLGLARTPRLITYLSEWEHQSAYVTFLGLFRLISGAYLSSHFVACGYWRVCEASGFSTQDEAWAAPLSLAEGGVGEGEEGPLLRFGSQYFFSLFFAVGTLFGTSDHPMPTTTLQRAFSLCVGFITVFLVAVIIGYISDVIQEAQKDGEEFRSRLSSLNGFLASRKVPSETAGRIRRFCYHQWSQKGAFADQAGVLDQLPSNLRRLLNEGKSLRRVSLFAAADPSFLSELSSRLLPRVYPPSQNVLFFGEIADECLILTEGEVEIRSASDKWLANLPAGSLIGEVALFSENSRRSATVRTRTWCRFLALKASDFDEMRTSHPKQVLELHRVAQSRIAKDSLRKHLPTLGLLDGVPAAAVADLVPLFAPYACPEDGSALIAKEGQEMERCYFVGAGAVLQLADRARANARRDFEDTRMGLDPYINDSHLYEPCEPGEFIGVDALMADSGVTWPANYRAAGAADESIPASPAILLGIDRAAFHAVLRQHDCGAVVDANFSNMLAERKHRRASLKRQFGSAVTKVRSQLRQKTVVRNMTQDHDLRAIRALSVLEAVDFSALEVAAKISIVKRLFKLQEVVQSQLFEHHRAFHHHHPPPDALQRSRSAPGNWDEEGEAEGERREEEGGGGARFVRSATEGDVADASLRRRVGGLVHQQRTLSRPDAAL